MGSGFIGRGRTFAGIVPPSLGPPPRGGGGRRRAAPAGGSTRRRPAAAAAAGPCRCAPSSATSGVERDGLRGPSPGGQDHQPGGLGDLPEAHPVVEVGERVAADQQVELGVRHLAPEVLQRLDRIGGPARGSARAARRRAPPRRAAPAPPWRSARGPEPAPGPACAAAARSAGRSPGRARGPPRPRGPARCGRGGSGRSCRRRDRSSVGSLQSRLRRGRRSRPAGDPLVGGRADLAIGQAAAPPPPGAAPPAARGSPASSLLPTISRGRSMSVGVERRELALDGRPDLRRRSPPDREVDQVDEHPAALDVAEELDAEARPLRRAGDQARQVGDDEGLVRAAPRRPRRAGGRGW